MRITEFCLLSNNVACKRRSRVSAFHINFIGLLNILIVSAYSVTVRVSSFDFALVTKFLGSDETGIGPVFMAKQLAMGALLEYCTITYDKDAISIFDCGEAMSDDDCCTA